MESISSKKGVETQYSFYHQKLFKVAMLTLSLALLIFALIGSLPSYPLGQKFNAYLFVLGAVAIQIPFCLEYILEKKVRDSENQLEASIDHSLLEVEMNNRQLADHEELYKENRLKFNEVESESRELMRSQ